MSLKRLRRDRSLRHAMFGATAQVLRGLTPDLESLGACSDGCWLWPSITQNAYQTAEVRARQHVCRVQWWGQGWRHACRPQSGGQGL